MTQTTRISTISRTYAQALLDVASDGSCDKLLAELSDVLEVLNASEDLKVVMANSSISISAKKEILGEIFQNKINVKLLNFLKILVEKNRFKELEAVRDAFSESIQKLSNKKTVEISSPIELNFENKSNILFKLEHKLGCEIKPVWRIDNTLIAGLSFRFDDYVIDTSVNAKLEELSKNISR